MPTKCQAISPTQRTCDLEGKIIQQLQDCVEVNITGQIMAYDGVNIYNSAQDAEGGVSGVQSMGDRIFPRGGKIDLTFGRQTHIN